MKKTLVGAAVVANGLCVVANQAHAAQPQKAVGGVTYDNGGGSSKLEVNGSGTPASGRIQVRNLSTGADYVGQVNCYSQSGNIARMTGVITSGVVADGP